MAKMNLTGSWSDPITLSTRELIQCVTGIAVISLGDGEPDGLDDGAIMRRESTLVLEIGQKFRARSNEVTGAILYRGALI